MSLPELIIDGPQSAVAAALPLCTEPTPGRDSLLLQLLHGDEKAVVIWWNGDLLRSPRTFDRVRGDGEVTLTHPGHPLHAIPPHVHLQDGHNIRAGVPLWLLSRPQREYQELRVIAAGTLHPLFNSATLDFWYPNGEVEGRYYISDPREQLVNPSDRQGSRLHQQAVTSQMDLLQTMDALPDQPPLRVPRAPGR